MKLQTTIAACIWMSAFAGAPSALACPGDHDRDGYITLDDMAYYIDCLTGPGENEAPASPESHWRCLDLFDLDRDEDVDLAEFAILAREHGLPCPYCGNGVIERGEQCDPPALGSCSASCRTIVSHDDCATPLTVRDGHMALHNRAAQTGGPEGACGAITDDLWFAYTATCTGYVTASLCGSTPDTVVEVFDTTGCPQGAPLACNNDGCGSGAQARVSFPAVVGAAFLLRVGTVSEPGEIRLSISCADTSGFASCVAGIGDCAEANGSAGCAERACCETVCAADAYCCDVTWDDACAATALSLCGGPFDACGAGAGDCHAANGSPGCSETTCCEAVCAVDWYCCYVAWGPQCARAAAALPACAP